MIAALHFRESGLRTLQCIIDVLRGRDIVAPAAAAAAAAAAPPPPPPPPRFGLGGVEGCEFVGSPIGCHRDAYSNS